MAQDSQILAKKIGLQVNGKIQVIGEKSLVNLKKGDKVKLIKKNENGYEDLVVFKDGDTLLITYADGSTITVDGFYALEDVTLELPVAQDELHILSSNYDLESAQTTVVYAQGDMGKFHSLFEGKDSFTTAINDYSLVSETGLNAGTEAKEAYSSLIPGVSDTMALLGGVLLAGGIAVAAAGSGGSSDDSSDDSSSSSAPQSQTGVFQDGIVAGATYIRMKNGIEVGRGVTDEFGKFTYLAGETIVFKIGNITLGEIAAEDVHPDGYVLPQDLAGVDRTETDNATVLLVAKILQTFGVSNEGTITIPENVDEILGDLEIDFTDENIDLNTTLQDFTTQIQTANNDLSTTLVIPTDDEAKEHLNETTTVRLEEAAEEVYKPGEKDDNNVVAEKVIKADVLIKLYKNNTDLSETEFTKVTGTSADIVKVISETNIVNNVNTGGKNITLPDTITFEISEDDEISASDFLFIMTNYPNSIIDLSKASLISGDATILLQIVDSNEVLDNDNIIFPRDTNNKISIDIHVEDSTALTGPIGISVEDMESIIALTSGTVTAETISDTAENIESLIENYTGTIELPMVNGKYNTNFEFTDGVSVSTLTTLADLTTGDLEYTTIKDTQENISIDINSSSPVLVPEIIIGSVATSGDDQLQEIQTIDVNNLENGSYKLTIGNTTLETALLGENANINTLVYALHNSNGYSSAPFMIAANQTGDLEITWNLPGEVSDIAYLYSPYTLNFDIIGGVSLNNLSAYIDMTTGTVTYNNTIKDSVEHILEQNNYEYPSNVTLASNVNFIVTDTSISVEDLNDIDAKTTGTVDISAVTSISGSVESILELIALLETNHITLKSDVNFVVSDTTISVTDLKAISAVTTGNVTGYTTISDSAQNLLSIIGNTTDDITLAANVNFVVQDVVPGMNNLKDGEIPENLGDAEVFYKGATIEQLENIIESTAGTVTYTTISDTSTNITTFANDYKNEEYTGPITSLSNTVNFEIINNVSIAQLETILTQMRDLESQTPAPLTNGIISYKSLEDTLDNVLTLIEYNRDGITRTYNGPIDIPGYGYYNGYYFAVNVKIIDDVNAQNPGSNPITSQELYYIFWAMRGIIDITSAGVTTVEAPTLGNPEGYSVVTGTELGYAITDYYLSNYGLIKVPTNVLFESTQTAITGHLYYLDWVMRGVIADKIRVHEDSNGDIDVNFQFYTYYGEVAASKIIELMNFTKGTVTYYDISQNNNISNFEAKISGTFAQITEVLDVRKVNDVLVENEDDIFGVLENQVEFRITETVTIAQLNTLINYAVVKEIDISATALLSGTATEILAVIGNSEIVLKADVNFTISDTSITVENLNTIISATDGTVDISAVTTLVGSIEEILAIVENTNVTLKSDVIFEITDNDISVADLETISAATTGNVIGYENIADTVDHILALVSDTYAGDIEVPADIDFIVTPDTSITIEELNTIVASTTGTVDISLVIELVGTAEEILAIVENNNVILKADINFEITDTTAITDATAVTVTDIQTIIDATTGTVDISLVPSLTSSASKLADIAGDSTVTLKANVDFVVTDTGTVDAADVVTMMNKTQPDQQNGGGTVDIKLAAKLEGTAEDLVSIVENETEIIFNETVATDFDVTNDASVLQFTALDEFTTGVITVTISDNIENLLTLPAIVGENTDANVLEIKTADTTATSTDMAKILETTGVTSFDATSVETISGFIDDLAAIAIGKNSTQGSDVEGSLETESHTLTFQELKAGQSVTVEGLTLTATQNMTATEVAAAFGNLDTVLLTEGNTVSNGIWSGQYSGSWYSSPATGADVTFTSQTENSNVPDISVSVSGSTGINSLYSDPYSDKLTLKDGVNLNLLDSSITAEDLFDFAASTNNTVPTLVQDFGDADLDLGGSITIEVNGTPTVIEFDNGTDLATKLEALSSVATATFGTGEDANVLTIVGADAGANESLEITVIDALASATTETHALTFQDLIAGQSVTVDGLTLTATGAITAADVAAGFASLAASATTGNAVTNGTWSGTLSANWSSGTATSAVVTFTSATANTGVTDIVVNSAGTAEILAPTAVGIVATQGSAVENALVTESNVLTFSALVAGQSVTVEGLTLTATGNISAQNVALAFSQLDPGQTEQLPNMVTIEGTWSGALSQNWYSSVASGTTVTFTSETPNTDVTDIDVSSDGTPAIAAPTAVGKSATQGSSTPATITLSDIENGTTTPRYGIVENYEILDIDEATLTNLTIAQAKLLLGADNYTNQEYSILDIAANIGANAADLVAVLNTNNTAVTITGEISAANVNTIAGATDGVLTATLAANTPITDATVTALSHVNPADVITFNSTATTADATALNALNTLADTKSFANLVTITEAFATANLITVIANALAIKANAAVEITGGEISASDLNTIAGATDGIVTATLAANTPITDATVIALANINDLDPVTLISTVTTADATALIALTNKLNSSNLSSLTTITEDAVNIGGSASNITEALNILTDTGTPTINVTITGEISASDLNTIAGATDGIVTATLAANTPITDATVDALSNVDATDVINLASTATTADATALVALDSLTTTGTVTFANVGTVTGSATEVTAALVTPATKVTVAVDPIVILEDTGTVAATVLSEIGGATNGTVTGSSITEVTGTASEVTAALVTPATKVTVASNATVTLENVGTVTATVLSAIGGATTGTVTGANITTVTGLASEVTAALVTPVTKVTVASNAAVTLDDSGSVAATVLSAIGGATTGTVTGSSITTVTGSASEVTAALVTAETKVTVNANAAVEITGGTISGTDLDAIADATGGIVTATVDIADVASLQNVNTSDNITVVTSDNDLTDNGSVPSIADHLDLSGTVKLYDSQVSLVDKNDTVNLNIVFGNSATTFNLSSLYDAANLNLKVLSIDMDNSNDDKLSLTAQEVLDLGGTLNIKFDVSGENDGISLNGGVVNLGDYDTTGWDEAVNGTTYTYTKDGATVIIEDTSVI